MLTGRRILVTGVTGQVADPLARRLAADNEVVGVARFRDPAAKAALEGAGVRCVSADLAKGDLSALPTDCDVVINMAVAKSGKWSVDLATGAEAPALLLAHCRSATAFVHCSSTAVYAAAGRAPRAEDAPLGDNHAVLLPTYSITKIAGEAAVRAAARLFGVPTVIARLNVPYGDAGGWPAFHLEMVLAGMAVPVHEDGPSEYRPLHDDDIAASLPALLDAASVPATTVNWAGEQTVSIEQWCTYLAGLAGVEARFAPTRQALSSLVPDLDKAHALGLRATVDWQDGFRRMAAALHPELPGLGAE